MFFFFNDTATTEIYTLSLHDALPICCIGDFSLSAAPCVGRDGESGKGGDGALDLPTMANRICGRQPPPTGGVGADGEARRGNRDRKSTRLNSSHANISYAVFCLKKQT